MKAPRHRVQYGILAALSLLAAALTTVVLLTDVSAFERFIGSTNPLIAAFVITAAGFLAFPALLRRGSLTVYSGSWRGVRIAAAVGTVLAVVMVLADTRIRFPIEINIPYPVSVAFYPGIAFYVEILWHVVPLTVLFLVARVFAPHARDATILAVSIPIVALVDPLYQVKSMVIMGDYASWAIAFVGVHVFLVNAAELWAFARFDFVAMYSLRLVYYLLWHVLWGTARVEALF